MTHNTPEPNTCECEHVYIHEHESHDHMHTHEHEHHEHEHHEHVHEHEYSDEGIHLNWEMQSGAYVFTAALSSNGNGEALQNSIAAALEAFAAELSEDGAVIGHIKAAVHKQKISMLSLTDTVVNVKEAPDEQVTATINAIIFSADPEKSAASMIKQLKTALHR